MSKGTGAMDQNVLFHEEQKFDSPWLRLLFGGLFLFLAGIFGYGIIQQLILKKPWGDRPMSDSALICVACISLLSFGGVLALLAGAKLTTEVRAEGFFFRFSPFHRSFQQIPFGDVQSWEAVTYRPLPEYGGWGIRYGLSGKAFNVRGNRGVRLTLRNGQRVLFGSQCAEELSRSLDSALHRTG